MDVKNYVEERRMSLQVECDASKTPQERNRLGQFATPSMLAHDILENASRLLDSQTPVRFLDPAIGTGSFYSALLRNFASERIAVATGFEIDPDYGRPACELWKDHSLNIQLTDFTTVNPSTELYNLIVCNPPYVRHHHLDTTEKRRLQTVTYTACGVRIGGLSGLYCYFMGLAHAWMADDGLAVWLVPSEFMDVNYGGPLKRYLLDKVELLRIHRFDPNELQFADALVSSAVIWFRKRTRALDHSVEFTYGGTHAKPTCRRTVLASSLYNEAKWTRFPVEDVRDTRRGWRLDDFFKIQRGLATGDNKFFILTREQIRERGLPIEFFKPILPGPRHLPMDVIEAETDGTPRIDKPLFMLDCRLTITEIEERYPKLWDYLKTGIPDVSERYLCRYRSPWYSQERRPAAPFLCTYMGRNAKGNRPIRFILNRSQATAANVYLMLYPKSMLASALERDPELACKVWNFLNGIDMQVLLGEGRVYGGGLYKMEPKELANVPADAIASLFPDQGLAPTATIQTSLWDTNEVWEKPATIYS